MYWTICSLQDLPQLPRALPADVHRDPLQESAGHGGELGSLLREIYNGAGHLHRLSLRGEPGLHQLLECKQIPLHRIHGPPGIISFIEAIILIDLFYMAGIKLVKRYDDGETCCAGVLIFLSVVFEAVAITFNVLGYIYFGSEDVCGSTLWVNIVNSIVIVLLPCTQFFNFNKQNSLLTTSLVSVYVSYLAFFAQFSYGSNLCIRFVT